MGNIRSSVSQFKLNSAATTNATLVKAGTGQLYTVAVSNINAAIRYLKLYDKATAPTVGTDVPILTIAIPITGVTHINFGTFGLSYLLGLGLAITTVGTDADATATAAGEQKVLMSYA